MKKVIVIIISAMISVSALADCREMYKKYKLKQIPAAAISTTGGVVLAGGAFYSVEIGMILAVFSSQQAFLTAGLLAGAGVSATGAIISVKGVKHGVEFIQKARSYNLIKESFVGSGDEVAELAEELSDELGKPVSEAQVVESILKGNAENVFCASKDTLFNKNAMVNYIKLTL